MTYLFYTKIKEDEHRNGQEVRIVEKHKNGYMVLVEFPDAFFLIYSECMSFFLSKVW